MITVTLRWMLKAMTKNKRPRKQGSQHRKGTCKSLFSQNFKRACSGGMLNKRLGWFILLFFFIDLLFFLFQIWRERNNTFFLQLDLISGFGGR